jgi:hypothetical protein
MAIIINNTEEKQVKILNSDIIIDNLYIRIVFNAKENGKNVEVELVPYQNREKYELGLRLNNISLPRTIEGEVEFQDLTLVHELIKNKLEELGFIVEITI